MHALVYTGTEKIVYREEKDPNKKPGEALIKVIKKKKKVEKRF